MRNIPYQERIESEISHGQKIASQAEKIWNWEGVIGNARYERRLKYLSGGLKRGMKCLEIGCGTGLFSKNLIRSGIDLVAIDISSDLLKQAKARVPNGVFFEADACHTHFSDESFDVILGSSILHHLDVDLALKEIHRILKPGGRIRFTEPNYLNPHIFIERRFKYFREKFGVSKYETAFVRWNLKSKLEKAGFKSIQIEPFDFLHPLFPDRCFTFLTCQGMVLERMPLVKEIAGSLKIAAIK